MKSNILINYKMATDIELINTINNIKQELKIRKEIVKHLNPHCDKCGSSFIYTRLKTKQIICRKCGSVTLWK